MLTNSMRLHLEETYLYKFHLLTKGLDRLFDTELRRHAGIGLSHFLILSVVKQHKVVSARDIARFLDVSPAAISRQLESAQKAGWVSMHAARNDGRSRDVQLTREGEGQVRKGLRVLRAHVFSVFLSGNRRMDLMSHVDTLLANIEGDKL